MSGQEAPGDDTKTGPIKIESKIVSVDIDSSADPGEGPPNVAETAGASAQNIAPATLGHEKLAPRPEKLFGATYKVKTPLSKHALYVTINDHVLDKGTENERRAPFEIFLNSKAMDHFQWIVALTLLISAVFRKGGDVSFVAEELASVFDPNGGYRKNRRWMPSLVAEIGAIIRAHLESLGAIDPAPNADAVEDSALAGARTCPKCLSIALVVREGCETCMACGESKCN